MTPETDEPEPTSCSTIQRSGQAYALFAISWVLVITIGSPLQIKWFRAGLVITELALILLPAILFIRWKRLPVAQALRWRGIETTTVLLSVAVGVTGWGVAAWIHELSASILGEPPKIATLQPQTFAQLLLIIVCAALLPGICEETLFRGAIQGMLRRRGPRQAILITAFLFAVYHGDPWSLVPAIFLGIVLGTLVLRTGSTVPAILAHAANNTMAFSVGYLYSDRPDSSAHALITALALLFFAVFPIFWIATRREKADKPILATVPAGLSRPPRWIAGIVGASALLLVVAAVAAALAFVELRTMSSDALQPEIQRGDRLVVLRPRFLDLDLEVGDVVLCPRDGETVLRRISRINGDRIWIRDGSSQLGIARTRVMGKVVHIIKAARVSQ